MRKTYPPKKASLAEDGKSRWDSPENQEKAFNKSLKYLSFRARSIKEVYDYLLRKNFREETINIVLKRLVDLKFLDDRDFAQQWIGSRQRQKGKSKFVIKNELRLKGVNDEIIEELLNEAEDDFETAKNLFEKKKMKLKDLNSEEFKKKITGFLQRKGYTFEIIGKLLKEV